MTSEAIKETVHSLAFIQIAMLNSVSRDKKLWDALYLAENAMRNVLIEQGFSWDALMHIERLGTVIYSKRELGMLTKSMLYWLA